MSYAARRATLALLGVAGFVTAGLLPGCIGIAHAGEACLSSAGGTSVTCTFAATGGEQLLRVPDGATSVSVARDGGQPVGDSVEPTFERNATPVLAKLPVEPGSTLEISVTTRADVAPSSTAPATGAATLERPAADEASSAVAAPPAGSPASPPTAQAAWVIALGGDRVALIQPVPDPVADGAPTVAPQAVGDQATDTSAAASGMPSPSVPELSSGPGPISASATAAVTSIQLDFTVPTSSSASTPADMAAGTSRTARVVGALQHPDTAEPGGTAPTLL